MGSPNLTGPTLSDFDGQLLDGLEFCAKTYALFESIRAGNDGRSHLRMRKGASKKLMEELLPICKYVQNAYRAGRYISVRWFKDNQKFDAEVCQSGAYIDQGLFPAEACLEVTVAVHDKEYLSRELLDTGGVAFGVEGIERDKKTRKIKSTPVIRTNGDYIDNYCPLLLEQIAKKVRKGYPTETTLIVECTLNTFYMPDEWNTLLEKVGAQLPAHKFREIFVYDAVSGRSHSFYGER